MNILPINNNIKSIIQCGDIHIRLNKRKDEYKEVFDNFFESIKNYSKTETIIVICGDLFHTKTDLQPEGIKLAEIFLRGCANLFPTILIAGNHDCNLNNKNRLDSLSPIVEAINHPNLFYLKRSGLYGLGNICINNYSIFDSIENYIKGKDIPQIYRNKYEYFISLFHGQVDGSITDLGFKISNPSNSIQMFDYHDIALLGDIHLQQTLQEYNFQNNKPIIRFAGSLIQQNHAEPLYGHGYTLWDLKAKTYKHVEIPNDYGFFTILLDNGVISTNLNDLPIKTRIRFQLKNMTPTEIKKALVDIRQLTDVVESCYQKVDTDIVLVKIPTSGGNTVLGNINDRDYQINLLKEFLRIKLNVTDQSFIDEIIKINNEINDSIKKDDFARNIRWVPIKFEWENMFSYGEKNIIDFTKLKDVVGLFAANASGKSSIFSAMTFCLFDKCEREFKAANIMNVQKTDFSCKFEFEIDNKKYFIQRYGKADKKNKVKVDVKFWKIENGQEIDLNGEQRKDTNEIIREYLGTYDDFVLTSLSVQSGKNNASIIDMGDAERKDLFSQFMGLTVFDRLYEEANERLKEQIVVLKTYKNDDYMQKLTDYTNLLGQAESLYNDEVKLLSEIGKTKEKIQRGILTETQKLTKIDTEIPSLSVSNSLLNKVKLNLNNDKNAIVGIEKNIEELTKQLSLIEHEIKTLEEKNIDSVYLAYQKFIEKKQEIENEKSQMKLNYERDIQICEKAEFLEYDPRCSYCVKNAGKVAIEAEEAKKRIEKLKNDVVHLKEKSEYVSSQIEESAWVLEARLNHMKLLKKRNDLKDEKLKFTGQLNMLHQSSIKLEESIKLHEKNIELYNKNSGLIQINDKIHKQISDYEKSLEDVEYSYKVKSKTVMDINSKISVCKNQISEINYKINQIKVAERKHKLYESYCRAVSRDGIPFDIITATVPEIQNEVNNILSQVADFTSLFETDGKNIVPYIVYNDKKWLMNLTSGFEKFVLSLAIRVALINISNLPRPNFLILDEPFGVLDSENLSKMDVLFSYLKSQFDFIIIISHIDAMKDIVDDIMEIKKEGKFSKVEYK